MVSSVAGVMLLLEMMLDMLYMLDTSVSLCPKIWTGMVDDWCCCLPDHWNRPVRGLIFLDVAQRCSTIGHGSKLLTPMADQMTKTYSKNLQFPPCSLAFLPYRWWRGKLVTWHRNAFAEERCATSWIKGWVQALHLRSQHWMVSFCLCSMHGNVNSDNMQLSNSPKEIDLLGYLLWGCLKFPVTRNTFSSKFPEPKCPNCKTPNTDGAHRLQLAAPCNMILGFGRNGALWRRWTRQSKPLWDGLDGLGWPLTGVENGDVAVLSLWWLCKNMWWGHVGSR